MLDVCSPVRFDETHERPAICLDLSLTSEGAEVCTYLLVASIEGSSNQSEELVLEEDLR